MIGGLTLRKKSVSDGVFGEFVRQWEQLHRRDEKDSEKKKWTLVQVATDALARSIPLRALPPLDVGRLCLVRFEVGLEAEGRCEMNRIGTGCDKGSDIRLAS